MTSNAANPQFSLVIPVFNEAESIRPLHQEIVEAMESKKWSFEIIFIDDHSTDGTAEVLASLGKEDSHVQVHTFKRNFGKSSALACGFHHARGKYVATMDGDLQDTPKEVIRLWQTMETQRVDVVSGWKKTRRDPLSKTIPSKVFNMMVRMLTGLPLHDFNCGLKLYRQEVIKEIPIYGELHRFIPVLAAWKGYRVTEKAVHHRARKFGKSKFGIERFLAGLIDLMNVTFLMRYERKPSHLFSALGLILIFVGTVVNAHLLIIKMIGGTIAPHYPYMVLGIGSLLVGIQFVFFGLLSEMIVYAFRSLKDKPPHHTS